MSARPQTEADVAVKPLLDEPLLPDDYPIYADYLYVADEVVVRSNWHGITARQFKTREGISELRRCDISGRQKLAREGERSSSEPQQNIATGEQA